MASHEVRFLKSAARDLDPFPKRDIQGIVAAIAALADNPRPPQARKLSAS
jgi:hypothetical protein